MNDELKCPKCNSDMKEFVTSFRCRDLKCSFKYNKTFPNTRPEQEEFFLMLDNLLHFESVPEEYKRICKRVLKENNYKIVKTKEQTKP